MSAFEMLAFFRFIKFYNEGEITMVSVRKRGKVYEYRFEIATVEGTRKWITKSGYPTKAEAFKEGAKAYNDFYYNLTILRLSKYANCNFKIKYRNTNSIY